MEGYFQIRISRELNDMIKNVVSGVPGLDLSSVIRRTVKYVNKANGYFPEIDNASDDIKNIANGSCSILVKVRDCEPPSCHLPQFRIILAYRCNEALEKNKNVHQFKTNLVEGTDYIIVK